MINRISRIVVHTLGVEVPASLHAEQQPVPVPDSEEADLPPDVAGGFGSFRLEGARSPSTNRSEASSLGFQMA